MLMRADPSARMFFENSLLTDNRTKSRNGAR
jgi:hypothetical protein